jgi:DNA-binding MurR/RpiR family transcriptional regulator
MNNNKKNSVFSTIRSTMPSFSQAERAFAKYILKNHDVIYQSITNVTEDSGTGYGTVIRFCQKLGFAGFQDFKIHLAQELGDLEKSIPAPSQDTLLNAAEYYGRQLIVAAKGIEEESINIVAERIFAALKILIIGVAGSYPAVADLTVRLCRIGINAQAEADSHMQAIRSSMMGSSDVLVAISFSGSTKEILDAVKQAKVKGAYIVAITNYKKSPLADLADTILSTDIWEEALESEIGSRLPLYFVIEMLAKLIYKKHPDAKEKLKVTADSVSSKQM